MAQQVPTRVAPLILGVLPDVAIALRLAAHAVAQPLGGCFGRRRAPVVGSVAQDR
jgi:hypothetical protein